MSRVQLALNVADLDEAVAFYTKLLGVEPAKVRTGYANFAVADPPLKLVLIEDAVQEPGSLNHLGIEVGTTEEVVAARDRLDVAGLTTAVEDGVTCCFAVQDKVWVDGPGGEPWEIYTVLDDAEMPGGDPGGVPVSTAPCCATRPDLATAPDAADASDATAPDAADASDATAPDAADASDDAADLADAVDGRSSSWR